MYNSDLPTRADLPTSKQLWRSTLIAAAVAALLLVTTILPAEYGIDPTGAGRYLGLTTMGEIKASLTKEAAPAIAPDQANEASAPPTKQVLADVAKTQLSAQRTAQTWPKPLASDQKTVTLKAGEATEIKLGMNKGASVSYEWVVAGGAVNFDTHGDAPGIDYYGYGKGRQVTGDKGVLEAAFNGKHGWFWRNRSASSVTITLTTQGDYHSIQRMM